MRKALRRILDHVGVFAVQEFSGAKEAIEYLKGHVVDLVISDIYLPKGSGLDVLRYVRSRTLAADIPVIFVTGEATKDDIVQSIELGANDYLIKPFGAQDLLGKIKVVLSRYRNPSERVKKLRAGESCLLTGQVEAALKIFREIHKEEPTSARILVGLAQAEAQFENYAVAQAHIEKAIEESAIYFPAYAVGADLLLKQGKRPEAIEFILKELSINGKQGHRRMLLADLYGESGDYKSAVAQIRQALLDDPRDENVLLKMADLLFLSGDPEKSLHYYLKTRRKIPHSMLALEGISHVCMSQNNPKKALNIFTDFLTQNPMRKDVLLVRSRLFERMGEFDQALGEVETYLISASDNIEALYLKGRLLLRLNMPEEAKLTWDEICNLSPVDENFAKVALVNLKLGQYRAAASFYEKALFLDGKNTKYLYNLGFAFEKMRDYARAKGLYEKVIGILPQHTEAREALVRVSKAPQTAARPPLARPKAS